MSEQASQMSQTTAKMKMGEYGVHVYIQESRELSGEDELVDPILKVQAFDSTQHSKIKYNVGSEKQYWGEHFFFNKRFTERSVLDDQVIKIEAYNHKLLGSDSLIGTAQVSLSQVYKYDEHALLHVWMGLLNYGASFKQRQRGFIKVSMNIYGEDDEQVELKDQKVSGAPQKSFDKENILAPSQVEETSYQMKISVVKAQKLPHMDGTLAGGKCDPYLRFEMAGQVIKTRTINNNCYPVYHEVILLPFIEPSLSKNLRVSVWDSDSVGAHDMIGSNKLAKKSIMEGYYKHYYWMNIYGSNIDGSQEYAEIMNNFPVVGSWWKGRVYLKLECTPDKNPKLDTQTMPDKTIRFFSKNDDTVNYQLNLQIFYALSLPNDSRYMLRVRWADMDFLVGYPSYITSNQGVYEINTTRIQQIRLPYQSQTELPDLFIYLVGYDGKPCYFLRKPIRKITNNILEPAELDFFRPDQSMISGVQNFTGGIIKMRCSIGPAENMRDLSIGGWNKPIKKEITTYRLLIVNVFQAMELFQVDNENSCVYAVIKCFHGQTQTFEIKNCRNPIWNMRIPIKVPVFDDLMLPPIIIQLFDKNSFFGSADFLGGTIITNIKEFQETPGFAWKTTELPEPQFYDLHFNKHTKTGRVLLSFNYTDDPDAQINEIEVPTTKYLVKINILGLRALKTLGMLDIQKAFIKMDVNSMLPQELKYELDSQAYIKTNPRQPGSNPNIQTIVRFDINLPTNIDYITFLDCDVQDYRFMGLYQQKLGCFNIDFKPYIEQQNNKLAKLKKKLKFLVKTKETLNLEMVDSQNKSHVAQEGEAIKSGDGNDQAEDMSLLAQKKELLETVKLIEDKMANPITEESNANEENVSSNTHNDAHKPAIEDSSAPVTKTAHSKTIDMEKSGLGGKMLSIMNMGFLKSRKMNVFDANKRDNKIMFSKKQVQVEIFDQVTGKLNLSKLIVPAKYEKKDHIYLETEFPSEDKYMAIGFDTKADKINKTPKKYYRYYVDEPLENHQVFIEKIFDDIHIKRQNRSEPSYEAKDSDQDTVGKFKGIITIINEQKYNKIRDKYGDLMNSYDKKINRFDKLLTRSAKVLVRVYILEVTGMYFLDSSEQIDPYIKVTLGDQSVDNRDEHLTNMTNAPFYRCFEMITVLPGSSQLDIAVYDYNQFMSDVHVGSTIIDLENRYLSKKWHKLTEKPIEKRNIYHPLSSVSKGKMSLWLEIMSIEEKQPLPIQLIAPKPPQAYEVRVVIYDCSGIPDMDIEGTSDIYITVKVDEKTETTDTHWRATGGKGSFNYRLLFNIHLPVADPVAIIQVWDKDLLSSDDYICSAELDFSQAQKIAYEDDSIQYVKNHTKKEHDILLQCYAKDPKDNTKQIKQGKVRLQFELMPQGMADSSPVGVGQQAPNHSPQLMPPSGRLDFQKNIIGIMCQFVGPKVKRMLCCACCLIICTAMLITAIPTVFGNLITKSIEGMLGMSLQA